MKTEDQQTGPQSVCYTVDMKMNRESLYHMVSVDKHLNPSAPLWVWLVFTVLLWICRAGCVSSIVLRIFGILHTLNAAIIFLILAYLVHTLGPGFIRSGLFNSDRSIKNTPFHAEPQQNTHLLRAFKALDVNES